MDTLIKEKKEYEVKFKGISKDFQLTVQKLKNTESEITNKTQENEELINLKLQSMTTERLLKDEIQKLQN